MATTGSVSSIRMSGATSVTPAISTGSVSFVCARSANGAWDTQGVNASSDLSNQRPNLPPFRAPMGWYTTPDGNRYPVQWDTQVWNFMRFMYETKLGGMNGATLPDVVGTVEKTQAQSATTSQTVIAVAQQTQANAESLDVARQVIQNNALTGANQIPPVSLGANIP